MLAKLLDVLFGCSHRNYSFPRTIRRGSARSAVASVTGTYVVCLKCGKELPYDWKEMKVVRVSQEPSGMVKPVESYVGKRVA